MRLHSVRDSAFKTDAAQLVPSDEEPADIVFSSRAAIRSDVASQLLAVQERDVDIGP
jgi:hypothetical protein